MSALKELTDYKNTIIERIVGNQNVIKALYYSHSDYESQPDLSVEEIMDKVLYSNIFPFNFIPTTDEELKTIKGYLTFTVSDITPSSKGFVFNSGSIYFSVYLHKDMFRTDYGHLRSDFLASSIFELFNQQRGIGIGKLEFKNMRETSINSNFHGFIMQFKSTDFSADSRRG